MLRPLAVLLLASGVAVAADPPAKTESFAGTATDAINHYIQEGYTKADIKKPADKAPELEFLRRAFIDLIGRIASPEEVLDFEQDKSPDKKAKLIKRLLNATEYTPKVNGQPAKTEDGKKMVLDYSTEFANHWANHWTVLLLSRTTHSVYRGQMQAWLSDEFAKNTPYNQIVKELITATGAGNKNGASTFLAVHLGDPIPGADRAKLGNHDAVPVTSRVTRLFLGIQTQCTQCHDHPFSKGLEQSDFWGVNAFFRQTTRSATPTSTTGNQQQMMKLEDKIDVSDKTDLNTSGIVYYEKRDGKTMASKPVFLKSYAQIETEDTKAKGAKPNAEKTRRESLADLIVGHDNFGRAYVNRVWGHLFGRGLQKDPTLDDFGSHNEIIHRELMDKLAGDFAKYNYNTKALLEWICTSDVYALGHVANKEYADQKYDPYFARMPLKAMAPEVLFDALAHATQSEAVTSKDFTRRRTLRDAWLGKLVRNFGDDEGNELTFNGTIVQALLMMNGKEMNDEVKRKDGVVEDALKRHAKKQGEPFFNAVLDDLFLVALNRHPSKAELATLKDILIRGGALKTDKPVEPKTPAPKTPTPVQPNPKQPNPKGPNTKGPNPMPTPGGPVAVGGSDLHDPTFYKDVFWALLNTNEFILNH